MLNKLLEKGSKVIEALAITSFLILFLLVLLQMLGRYLGLNGIGWTDEMISCFTTWMAALGMSYLAQRKWHVQVTILLEATKGVLNRLLRILIEGINVACGLAIAYSGRLWLANSAGKITAILQVQYVWWYSAILVFGCTFAFFSFFHLLASIVGLFQTKSAESPEI